MSLKNKYKHLVAWCKMNGSYDYYVKAQLEMAEQDGAPEDAIYLGRDGWETFESVTDPVVRARIEALLPPEVEG